MEEEVTQNILAIVEALIFASTEPVSESKIAKAANIDTEEVRKSIDALNIAYRETNRSFEIRFVAGGYAFYILPDYAPWIDDLLGRNKEFHLSRAMFETLAVIALKQPVTKPIIEKIRGVNSSAPVTSLAKLGLITIRGRSDGPGKPFLYATTPKFLKLFGLNRPEDIPSFEELEKLFDAGEPQRIPQPEPTLELSPTIEEDFLPNDEHLPEEVIDEDTV